MAIYHFSVKSISRKDGGSAVACAAYRSGEKLTCDYYGKEQDYTKKQGVEFTQIYAPPNTNMELLDRNTLWNTVEKVERRKDANLAREFEIAFPHELNAKQRQAMLNELCQELVKRHGVIVDAAIHAPHHRSDERNYHAHIMFTGRQIDLETGVFAKKRNRDFNKENSSQTVSQWRETFAELTNKHLAYAGYLNEVDHRSYADQNNAREATFHEGSKITQLRRKGIETDISRENDLIKQRNLERDSLLELNQDIKNTQKVLGNLQKNAFDQLINAKPEKLDKTSLFSELNASIDQYQERNQRLETEKKRPTAEPSFNFF